MLFKPPNILTCRVSFKGEPVYGVKKQIKIDTKLKINDFTFTKLKNKKVSLQHITPEFITCIFTNMCEKHFKGSWDRLKNFEEFLFSVMHLLLLYTHFILGNS